MLNESETEKFAHSTIYLARLTKITNNYPKITIILLTTIDTV